MNWLLAVLAALCLGLNAYNAITTDQLRSLRGEFQQRQAYLNQGIRLRQINSQLINALANVAATQDDESIRQMLASEGVTYSLNEETAATSGEEEAGPDND